MSGFLRKYAVGSGADLYITMIKRAVVDHAVSADWTPATGDVKVSIDGAATANIGTLPVAVAMGNSAIWKFVFTNAELTGKQINVTIADSATKAVEDNAFIIETYGNASAMYVLDLGINQTGDSYARLGAPSGASISADILQVYGKVDTEVADIQARLPAALTANGNMKSSMVEILTTALTETAGLLAGGFKKFFNVVAPTLTALGVDQTGDNYARIGAPSGASVSADILAVYGKVDTEVADIQARLPAALTGAGNMKTDALAINGSINAAANLARGTLGTTLGTCAALGSTTSVIASSLDPASAVDSQWNGKIITFDRATTTAALRGQSTNITAYTHATTTFTVTALTTAPVSGDTFTIS